MEKELRLIKNRGYFPAPYLAPRECKIETIQDKEAIIKEIDEVAVEMLTAIRESEENYKKEQEQARIREEQLRSARQTSRSDINLLTLANSTPIRNTNTRSTKIHTYLFTTVQWQNRRIPQVPQSHNSETTRNLCGMGRPSMESHSSI